MATVSRVLNGTARVSDAARLRVEKAVRDLGYLPNAAARRLSLGRTQTIGIVAPHLENASTARRLRGLIDALTERGFDISLGSAETPARRARALTAVATRTRVDGIVVVSAAPTEAELRDLDERHLPVVLVDRPHPTRTWVGCDDRAGGRSATEHLVALGHRRIGFVGDAPPPGSGYTSSRRRRLGYADVVAEAGLEHDAALVVEGGWETPWTATESATRLLTLAEPPTAIVAADDMIALAVIEAARVGGLRVPDDLSVVGYDDLEVARITGLTTVHQPLEETGRHAAELVLDAIAGRRAATVVLPTSLVVRRSTAPPRRA